jgi:RecJ-like exonuclease
MEQPNPTSSWEISISEHVDRLKNTHTITCKTCNGVGVFIALYSPRMCKECNGHGYYTKYKDETHILKENDKWYEKYLKIIKYVRG